MQKLHQIENRHSVSSGIYVRNYLCTCLPCRDQDFKNCQTISTDTFRTSPETVRFHWFTYKCKKGDEESDSDSDAALDDDDVANSDGVISESLLQVGDIAVIWADDLVFFLYLIKVTQEETILEKFMTDVMARHILLDHVLLKKITSKFQVKTLTKQPTSWRKRKQQYFPILLLAFALN